MCSGEGEEGKETEEVAMVAVVEKVERVGLEARAMLGLALGIEKVGASEAKAGERDRAVRVGGG